MLLNISKNKEFGLCYFFKPAREYSKVALCLRWSQWSQQPLLLCELTTDPGRSQDSCDPGGSWLGTAYWGMLWLSYFSHFGAPWLIFLMVDDMSLRNRRHWKRSARLIEGKWFRDVLCLNLSFILLLLVISVFTKPESCNLFDQQYAWKAGNVPYGCVGLLDSICVWTRPSGR